MREKPILHILGTQLLPLAIASLVLALSGPFGTYTTFTLGERLAFWALAVVGGAAFIQTSVLFALTLVSDTMRQKIGAAIVGTILGSIPSTAVIMYIYGWFIGTALPQSSFPNIWGNVVLVGIVISLANVVPREWRKAVENSKPDKAEESDPLQLENVPLLKKLPDGLRPCQIMSFSMQDHYVEVTTTEGKDLLLMRLGDAINQLGTLRGERVHRSHWVSLRHLVDIRKDGRRHVAVLTDDRTIPISGPYLECAQNLLKEKSAAE